MVDPIASWHEEHANFARLLDMLEAQAKAFQEGELANYELMTDIVHYLRSFGDCMHHLRENAAFARLVARDPGMKAVVQRLMQEHRVIGVAGDTLCERLDEAVDDVMFPRAALEAAAATYLVYYRHHLSTEEEQIIPRAQELLSPEDWAQIWQTFPRAPDPLFGADVEGRFLELRRQIDREPQRTPA